MVQVKIYSTQTCPFCNITRSLQSRDILQKLSLLTGG